MCSLEGIRRRDDRRAPIEHVAYCARGFAYGDRRVGGAVHDLVFEVLGGGENGGYLILDIEPFSDRIRVAPQRSR